MSDALVVIPTYNEAENLPPLLEAVFALPNFDVLVVDDSSPDGTAQIVERLKSQYANRLHLLVRPIKEGLGRAYIDGFRWALQRPYSFIFEMDADFSHPPEALIPLLEAAKASDLALGTRYRTGGKIKGWPIHRWLLSRAANLFASAAIGTTLSDLTGGLKCFRRGTLERLDLSTVRSSGYTFQIEMSVRVLDLGLKITEVPFTFRERVAGQSKIASFRTTWETFALVCRLGWNRRRRH